MDGQPSAINAVGGTVLGPNPTGVMVPGLAGGRTEYLLSPLGDRPLSLLLTPNPNSNPNPCIKTLTTEDNLDVRDAAGCHP